MRNDKCKPANAGIWAIVAAILALIAMVVLNGCFAKESIGDNAVDKALVVPQNMLPLLAVGPDELPWDMILHRLTVVPDAVSPSAVGESLQGPAFCDMVWFGPMVGDSRRPKSQSSITVLVMIAVSCDEAGRAAEERVTNGAVAIPEVTGRAMVNVFADRAWYSDNGSKGRSATLAHMVFVRRNVVCDLSIGHRGRLDTTMLFTLASRLGRKIDAAAAGKPEPAPVLPLAADQELRVDPQGAWKLRGLGNRLWKNQATTIAVYDKNGFPRSLPAKRAGVDDYVVPLRYLAAILSPNSRIEMVGDEARVTFKNKYMVFNKGKSGMRVDHEAADMDHPAEFAEGEVLVPLTFVVSHGSPGKRLGWEKRGDVMIGRVK